MRDREYSAFMLLNLPGYGTKSIQYVYDNLHKNGLKLNDLFDKTISELADLLPDLGHGKFSRAQLSSLFSLNDQVLYERYQQLKSAGVIIIGLDDERYPTGLIDRLKENTPPVLFCKGYLPLLNKTSISIVGSRDVSDKAIEAAKRIAGRIAGAGYNVTSGFAKGVDTSAHIGALEANGTTTMVLSYGFDHLSIKRDIKEFNWERNALFISQFMPYEKFSGQNAMIRNKLVCALSAAVIVICSGPERDSNGKMSGTFDAGLTSLRYKIPLYVLNPSLLNPVPQGNIDLIKLGGIPLSNGNELVQSLDLLEKAEVNSESASLAMTVEEPIANYRTQSDEVRDRILDILKESPLSVNDIIEKAQLDWTSKKAVAYLKKMDEIEVIKKGRSNYYKRKNVQTQPRLFA